MRLMQAMRDKIDMYDRCILALGHESEPDTPVGDMVYFLEEERNRVRSELKEFEDGTHELFGSLDHLRQVDEGKYRLVKAFALNVRLDNP